MIHAARSNEGETMRARPADGRRDVAVARVLLVALAALLSAACGEYGGGDVVAQDTNSEAFAAGSGIDEADQIATFEDTLHPVLRAYTCTDCHTSNSDEAPFDFADANSTTAFRAIVDNNRVNFANPGQSRLVARLLADGHHCWSDCASDGAEMLAAVQAWVNAMDDLSGGLEGGLDVGGEALASETLTEFDGETDEGGERYTRNQIAFWKFDEYDPTGSPSVARDSSGVAPAIDLTLEGDVEFMQSYGIDIADGRAIAPTDTSSKLWDYIADPDNGSGQYSIEAWVVPANTTQEGPARIVTYSRNPGSRNFMLGQVLYQYVARNRNTGPDTNNNGTPALETYDVDQDLQAALQHVVLTYDRRYGRRIFVDGFFTDDYDEANPSPLWNWARNHQLVLGNEAGNDPRQWVGQIRMLAIYSESMPPEAIRQNYEAGVGLRVKMSFDVSRWAGDGAVIEMSRSQIDDQSYLFCQPTLVSQSPGIRLQNMRVRVNGIEPSAGQAFTNVSAIVQDDREVLSRGCTIVENPPGDDEFDLVFEVLGPYADPVDAPTYDPITYDYSDAVALPTYGVRDFGRINATMIELTGVDPFAPSLGARLGENNGETLQDVYDDLRQQLPDSFDVRSFVSSHQVSVTKLGLEYCAAMIDDDVSRNAFFDADPTFDWDGAPASSLADSSGIVGPLVEKMISPVDANQPEAVDMETRLDVLITDLLTDCGGSGACSTRDVVAGACTATLASATMMMH